jgi:hypothetical protein
MPTLVYPVSQLITRLDGVAELKLVGVAADLVGALNQPPRTAPAAQVVANTTGGALKYSGPPIQQDRTTTIAIVLWVNNHGPAAQVRAEMDALQAAVDARLAGWTPGNAFSELLFQSARDEFSHGAYLVSQMTFQSRWNFSANFQL